ncbi:PA14 domain-containing protein [Haloferula chungangensis]|uniref:PA14 domain-containing protein n=1 Tax=Haloferula chungangensis TaxID=1048331 RepID=A0ABW2L2L6_9BACT
MTKSLRAMRAVLVVAGLSTAAYAQDGGQLFASYCSACHAPDGKGATGGQFPPLAGSAWIHGGPERAIKVVLHGLQGPVDVAGKTYDLVMPPQGSVLPDDQIAAILTFIRSSWGNRADKVSAAQVKAVRESLSDRNDMWTQDELLKLHPLPKPTSAVENLISYQYEGRWEKLPDFSKLTPIGVEEEHAGFMETKIARSKKHFGLVWEGDLVLHREGHTRFQLSADDGARVIINGETVVEVDGIGPIAKNRTKVGRVVLKGKKHKIRVEYFQNVGEIGLQLAWAGNGVDQWQRLGDESTAAKPLWPSIAILPSEERGTIYRNFIAGTTPRAIGIGLTGGINFAYSADHLAPELLWTGKFMDGGRHWTNRGQGAEPPSGKGLVKASGAKALPAEAKFRGYRLDRQGNPTFTVQLGELTVNDQFKSNDGKLLRVFSAVGEGDDVEILLSDQFPVKPINDHLYEFGSSMTLQIENADLEIRDSKAFLKLAPGASATLTYSWK